MDPLLQYAISSDGVGIAYWSMGEGQALIIPPILVSSHLELEWQIVSRRAFYEGLAHGIRVVRYDCRGIGMSQRDQIDFSIDAAIEDLEAVRSRLGLERFSLLRLPSSGDVALAYAARYPDRVANLIIWEGHTVPDDRDKVRVDQIDAVEPVIDRHWALYVKIRARINAGWDGSNAPIIEDSLRASLFTDLEIHTPMMQRLGDEQGREVLREHEIITREALGAYGGSEVKTMGDSFMASFGSATRALECAIAIQKAFADRNATTDEPLSVRVGLSAGEPIAEDEDLFGSSVILASRIAGQAKGGEIVLANVVRELAAGKGFLFSDRGEVALRGFEDPVRLYDLRWDGAK